MGLAVFIQELPLIKKLIHLSMKNETDQIDMKFEQL